jgi:hypothetical protein
MGDDVSGPFTMLEGLPTGSMNHSLDTSLPRGSGEDHLAGNVVCGKVRLSPLKNYSSGVGQTQGSNIHNYYDWISRKVVLIHTLL